MRPIPIPFYWDGDAMIPRDRYRKQCDKQFAVGAEYPLVVEEPRSRANHNHYFAAVTEAWRNLPERIVGDFPTVEHLRKFALIKAGFCDKRSHIAASNDEALRFAAFVRPIDEYAITATVDNVVTIYTAQSQSVKAMGKELFRESKTCVLDILAQMIGTDVATLSSEARSAA